MPITHSPTHRHNTTCKGTHPFKLHHASATFDCSMLQPSSFKTSMASDNAASQLRAESNTERNASTGQPKEKRATSHSNSALIQDSEAVSEFTVTVRHLDANSLGRVCRGEFWCTALIQACIRHRARGCIDARVHERPNKNQPQLL